MSKYREKNSKSDWGSPAEVVIRERVTMTGPYSFSGRRPLEEQVEQMIQIMAEMCEVMNIDASKFNSSFERVGDEEGVNV